MSVLLHISDTHFGTEQAPVVEALEALARERRPDLVVLSGDITQRATPAQFAAARRLCDALHGGPLLALPGNHDIPLLNVAERLLRPYARYLAAFGPRLDPVLETDNFLVIGVNTTRAYLHKDGEVSPAQVQAVVRQLRQASASQLRVVVTHQPSAVYRQQDEHDRLRGAGAALQAWSAAGADLVLGGHIHLPYVLDLAAQPKPTPRRMWCVQAGTAVSDRVRHDTSNSVNLIHWHAPAARQPRSCLLQRFDYDTASAAFAIASELKMALA